MLMVDIDTKISIDELIAQIKSVSNENDNWLIYETVSGYHVFNTTVYNAYNNTTYHPIMDYESYKYRSVDNRLVINKYNELISRYH